MKRILTLAIILILLNCSYKLNSENVSVLPSNETGTLSISFPMAMSDTENGLKGVGYYGYGDRWKIAFYLDYEYFMRDDFKQGESFSIALPSGEHNLLYRVALKSFKPFVGKFALNSESYSNAQKRIMFKIEKGRTTELIIIPKESKIRFSWGTNITTIFVFLAPVTMWPFGLWPVFEQDISLEVKK